MPPASAMACRRSLQPAQRAMLLRHDWPGNVRELQNAAERFALGLELALDGQPRPAQRQHRPCRAATSANRSSSSNAR
jgi:DNA-binding NtrC family response regulator